MLLLYYINTTTGICYYYMIRLYGTTKENSRSTSTHRHTVLVRHVTQPCCILDHLFESCYNKYPADKYTITEQLY